MRDPDNREPNMSYTGELYKIWKRLSRLEKELKLVKKVLKEDEIVK